MEDLKTLLKPIKDEVDGIVRVKDKWLRDGVVILPNSFVFDKRVSPQAKTLLAALCAHAFLESRFALYEKRDCRVSRDLLKEELGVSGAWVSKYLKELQKIKIIVIKRTGRSSFYEVDLAVVGERAEWVIKHIKKTREKLKSDF